MAILPPERARERRERDFQARVLAALEKPKRNRFFAIINSAAFLWLLSAFVLSLGGAYFTSHQQCIAEADQLSATYEKLVTEIQRRQLFIVYAVQSANDIDSLKKVLIAGYGRYPDLRIRPLYELIEQRDKLLERIDYSTFGEEILKRDRSYKEMTAVLDRQGVDVSKYEGIFQGEDTEDLGPDDLEPLKRFAKVALFKVNQSVETTFRVTLPNCLFVDFLHTSLTGEKRRILIPAFDIIDTFQPDDPDETDGSKPPDKAPNP